MQVLAQRYYGMIARCNRCGAILGYKPEDVDKEQHIHCPSCEFIIWVPLNINYEGVVENDADNE